MTHSLFCARDTLLKGAVICYGDIVFRPGVLEALLQDPHPWP
jgi:choline kinase